MAKKMWAVELKKYLCLIDGFKTIYKAMAYFWRFGKEKKNNLIRTP